MAVPHVLNRPAHQRHHSLPCATSHRALVIAARGLSASRRPLDAWAKGRSATTAAPALALKEAGRHQGLQDGRNRTAWVRSRGSFVFFVKMGEIWTYKLGVGPGRSKVFACVCFRGRIRLQ